jgi:hypothetical protein
MLIKPMLPITIQRLKDVPFVVVQQHIRIITNGESIFIGMAIMKNRFAKDAIVERTG